MASSSGSEYPLVDFSDIPGCESPLSTGTGRSFRTNDSSLASSTVSKSTKSRLSSIFSQTSTLDTSDDDVFGLTQSARKIRHSHHHQKTKILTGLLIEIEEQIESPSSSLTDWERLKKEAQAIAGEMTGERTSTKFSMTVDKVIDFDEILSKSPLAGSPLFATRTKNEFSVSPLSPPPKRLIDFDDDIEDDDQIQKSVAKENNQKENRKCSNAEQEVYLDDQLESAIKKQQLHRLPLSTLNMCTNDQLLPLKKVIMTPKNFVKTPNSKIIATPNSKFNNYTPAALKPVVGPRIGTPMLKNSVTATFPTKNKQPSILNKRITPLSSLPPKVRVKPSPSDRRTLMKPSKDVQKHSENGSAITIKNTPASLQQSKFRENNTTTATPRVSSSVKTNLVTRRSLLPNKEATPKLPTSFLVARRSLLPSNNQKNITPKVSSNILKTNLNTRRSLLPNKGITTNIGNNDNISSSGIPATKKNTSNYTPSSLVSKYSISSSGPATKKISSNCTAPSSSVSKSSENLIKSRRRSDLPKPFTTTKTISKNPSKIGSALPNKPYSRS